MISRKSVITTIKIPEDLLEQIDQIAREKNTTRSVIIRIALDKYVREYRTQNESGFIRTRWVKIEI